MASNPRQNRNSLSSRRARKLNLFVEHVDKRVLWKMYGGLCALCGDPLKFSRVTIDHRIPLSQGGEHSYENTQPTHGLCNHIKADGEFSFEKLWEAQRRRARRRSKGYRNTTGRRRGGHLTTASGVL